MHKTLTQSPHPLPSAWSIAGVSALAPPDMPALVDLLDALRELRAVVCWVKVLVCLRVAVAHRYDPLLQAIFLRDRHLISPALAAQLALVEGPGFIDAMPINAVRQALVACEAALAGHMTKEAVIALRVFVHGGSSLQGVGRCGWIGCCAHCHLYLQMCVLFSSCSRMFSMRFEACQRDRKSRANGAPPAAATSEDTSETQGLVEAGDHALLVSFAPFSTTRATVSLLYLVVSRLSL